MLREQPDGPHMQQTAWAIALVRAGYAANAQATNDSDVSAIAERTQLGKTTNWWLNDPSLPLGRKLHLAPQQVVFDSALLHEHICAHVYVEVECDLPQV